MEFLVLTLVTFVFFIYGVSVGWKARERHALKLTQQMLEGLEEKLEEEQKDKVYITIEKHNGMIYIYDKKTNQFMGQGSSKEELEDVLKSRFPGKKFAASQEDLEKAGLLS